MALNSTLFSTSVSSFAVTRLARWCLVGCSPIPQESSAATSVSLALNSRTSFCGHRTRSSRGVVEFQGLFWREKASRKLASVLALHCSPHIHIDDMSHCLSSCLVAPLPSSGALVASLQQVVTVKHSSYLPIVGKVQPLAWPATLRPGSVLQGVGLVSHFCVVFQVDYFEPTVGRYHFQFSLPVLEVSARRCSNSKVVRVRGPSRCLASSLGSDLIRSAPSSRPRFGTVCMVPRSPVAPSEMRASEPASNCWTTAAKQRNSCSAAFSPGALLHVSGARKQAAHAVRFCGYRQKLRSRCQRALHSMRTTTMCLRVTYLKRRSWSEWTG